MTYFVQFKCNNVISKTYSSEINKIKVKNNSKSVQTMLNFIVKSNLLHTFCLGSYNLVKRYQTLNNKI